jgi:hypothetical protein
MILFILGLVIAIFSLIWALASVEIEGYTSAQRYSDIVITTIALFFLITWVTRK